MKKRTIIFAAVSSLMITLQIRAGLIELNAEDSKDSG